MIDKIDTVLAVDAEINALLQKKESIIAAIDGRCGSGKTTLAGELKRLRGCEVIHMDHFYPRLEQRTTQRLSEPGGNLDRERFFEEVMTPLMRKEPFSYRPYNPMQHCLMEPISISLADVVVIEGSYCLHPLLFDCYDLRIFLTVDMPERLRRIKLRNGEEGLLSFQERWIPMEEKYFSAYDVQARSDMVFKTG